MLQWIDLVTGKKEMLKDIYTIVMRINKFYRAHMLNLCFFLSYLKHQKVSMMINSFVRLLLQNKAHVVSVSIVVGKII